MGPRRIVDAEEIAASMRTTFANRAIEHRQTLPFDWPERLQNVGKSLAVAYGSDKWKKPNPRTKKRPVDLYKHLAESPNWAFCQPDIFYDADKPSERLDLLGPMVSLTDLPLPRHFAYLGFCDSVILQLFVEEGATGPVLGSGDDGIVVVQIASGQLGASKIRWNEVEPYRSERNAFLDEGGDPDDLVDFDQPFIFVYTEEQGVHMIIVGERLDIEKDGIVG